MAKSSRASAGAKKLRNLAKTLKLKTKTARKKVTTTKKTPKQPKTMSNILHPLVDARHRSHISSPLSTSPYAVLRTRVSYALNSPPAGSLRVALIGEHYNPGSVPEVNVTPLISIDGQGTAVPGTTEGLISDPQITSLAGSGAFGRLHAITVTVQCGSTATTAEGFFYLGTMPGNINRTAFATWNDVGNAIITRREASMYSAYGSMTYPKVAMGAPQDASEWSSNALISAVNATTGTNRSTDTLLPIALVLMPTTATVQYVVTVNCEWRVLYPMGDARAGLHTTYPSASMGAVKAATLSVNELAGAARSGGGIGPSSRAKMPADRALGNIMYG